MCLAFLCIEKFLTLEAQSLDAQFGSIGEKKMNNILLLLYTGVTARKRNLYIC